MKILSLFQRLVMLCVVLIGFYCPMSLADKRPIITLSVGSPLGAEITGINNSPAAAYIIKIFANGYVEYNGLNAMDVMGKRDYQIDNATLKSLLKKSEKEYALLSEQEQEFPSLMSGVRFSRYSPTLGIRFRLTHKEATLIGENAFKLSGEIIKATKAERWGVEKAVHSNIH
jgi:hypothetical protein